MQPSEQPSESELFGLAELFLDDLELLHKRQSPVHYLRDISWHHVNECAHADDGWAALEDADPTYRKELGRYVTWYYPLQEWIKNEPPKDSPTFDSDVHAWIRSLANNIEFYNLKGMVETEESPEEPEEEEVIRKVFGQPTREILSQLRQSDSLERKTVWTRVSIDDKEISTDFFAEDFSTFKKKYAELTSGESGYAAVSTSSEMHDGYLDSQRLIHLTRADNGTYIDLVLSREYLAEKNRKAWGKYAEGQFYELHTMHGFVILQNAIEDPFHQEILRPAVQYTMGWRDGYVQKEKLKKEKIGSFSTTRTAHLAGLPPEHTKAVERYLRENGITNRKFV